MKGGSKMKKLDKEEIKKKVYSRDWKEKNQEYLQALEKFLDVVDNINDDSLKIDIIYKMLKCDEILTKIAEENMNK